MATRADSVATPTVKMAPVVYGGDPDVDDLAELYHEASKIYPSFGARQTRGYLLEQSAELRHSAARAAKRSSHLPCVVLPEPILPAMPLAAAIEARRSDRALGAGAVSLGELAALTHAAYGITHQLDPSAPAGTPPLFRAVPSGGGLYPLELYVFAFAVDELEPALYHFDPYLRVLELVGEPGSESELRHAVGPTSVYPETAAGCAVLFVISAMFWRTRFKYGLRGYRFALLEAGHLAQNLLLTGTALELACIPLGGFFDRRMDELLDLDGVNESMLYTVAVGRSAE